MSLMPPSCSSGKLMQKGKPYEVIDGDICQCVPSFCWAPKHSQNDLSNPVQLETQRLEYPPTGDCLKPSKCTNHFRE